MITLFINGVLVTLPQAASVRFCSGKNMPLCPIKSDHVLGDVEIDARSTNA